MKLTISLHIILACLRRRYCQSAMDRAGKCTQAVQEDERRRMIQ